MQEGIFWGWRICVKIYFTFYRDVRLYKKMIGYARQAQALRPTPLSTPLREQFRHISETLPDLWMTDQITQAQRKGLLHTLIQQVTVRWATSDTIEICIVWIFGHYSQLSLTAAIHRAHDVPEYDRFLERIQTLWVAGMKDKEIAAQMTQEGFHSARLSPVSAHAVLKARLRYHWQQTPESSKRNANLLKRAEKHSKLRGGTNYVREHHSNMQRNESMSSMLSNERLLSALHAWHLPEVHVVQRLSGGFTSEIWKVEAGSQYFVAKYAYQSQEAFEGGLYAAELAEQYGIMSAAPLRTKEGALSTLIEGPHGEHQPLALLRFVAGEPLRLEEPGTAGLYGNLLGRTHRIFLKGGGEKVPFDTYDFLQAEDTYVTAQPGLASLIRQTLDATRAYETRCKVTTGVIWADRVEILHEQETGRVGIIDWGAIERGPLLFDVALSVLWFYPEGSRMHEEFLQAYLAEAPITVSELEGLSYYKALVWARQAKYFAYRVAANVTLGSSNPDSNEQSLKEARQELERLLIDMTENGLK